MRHGEGQPPGKVPFKALTTVPAITRTYLPRSTSHAMTRTRMGGVRSDVGGRVGQGSERWTCAKAARLQGMDTHPDGSIQRMTWFKVSATNTLLELSTAMPLGELKPAVVRRPSSKPAAGTEPSGCMPRPPAQITTSNSPVTWTCTGRARRREEKGGGKVHSCVEDRDVYRYWEADNANYCACIVALRLSMR